MSSSAATPLLSTCPYCGTGCGLDVSMLDGRVRATSGNADYPVNQGRICVKGSTLPDTMGEKRRLLSPYVDGLACSWEHALDTLAVRLGGILSEHGPDSVAMLVSGQLCTEDLYVANKLMKGFIGSANIDSSTRVGNLAAAGALRQSLGADLLPCDFDDLTRCDLLVLAGVNPAWSHPVLFQRIHEAKRTRPGMRIVLIDPRRTVSAEIADLHLPLAPGSDTSLFLGLLHHLQARGGLNQSFLHEHVADADSALGAATECNLETVSRHTGLDPELLQQFYQWFARTERTVTLFSVGLSQSLTASDACHAVINCHLATGRIGKVGMGPFPLSGQGNAMGVREVGAVADQLAAHMDFENDNLRRVERFWRAPNPVSAPGLRLHELAPAIASGRVKALWIMGSNPVLSVPGADAMRSALQECELLVASDCFADTETVALAHIRLPAAAWGERQGTVTNGERRLSRQAALIPVPGEARADWWMLCAIARRLGFSHGFDYAGPDAIFAEHAALSAWENDGSRSFNLGTLAGMSADEYAAMPSRQWPVSAQRPFADGRFPTADGRAHMQAVRVTAPVPPEHYDTAFQLLVTRLRDPWLGMSRTENAPRLFANAGQPELLLNPRDARSLGIEEGDLVRLYTRSTAHERSTLLLRAAFDKGLRDGDLNLPMHWPARLCPQGGVNTLSGADAEPISGAMNGKRLHAGLMPVPVARWISLVSRQALTSLPFAYWSRTPVTAGQRYTLAILAHEAQHWQPWLETLTAGFADLHTHTENGNTHMFCSNGDRIDLALFSSDRHQKLPDDTWLSALLKRRPGPDTTALLHNVPATSREGAHIVCHCYQVSEQRILVAIADGNTDLESLGRTLRCGSNCGSCIPELLRLISARR
ncbi:MAG: molybdopterin-dependent oxidoreductase [Pseudomonadales bacterium]|nr:molybdopterin-dependent oxidoreductase [Pseudomonadales bacterium]